MTSGSQPPWAIFSALAPKNARSIDQEETGDARPRRRPAPAFGGDDMQQYAVITIVKVTAIPYAAASAVDDPKPITMTMVLTISAQLTCGT